LLLTSLALPDSFFFGVVQSDGVDQDRSTWGIVATFHQASQREKKKPVKSLDQTSAQKMQQHEQSRTNTKDPERIN
jgi:predicted component of type VI protein secretion system